MANFNKVILVGNLTRDPELRYTPKGLAVARIGMAVNRRWMSENGEQREETTFVDIDAFGKQAETVCQYMKKGSSMLVEGRLRLDQWDDKQTGQKRSRLMVVLESSTFLGSPNRGAEGQGAVPAPPAAPARPAPPAAAPAPAPPIAEEPHPQEEDDVPF